MNNNLNYTGLDVDDTQYIEHFVSQQHTHYGTRLLPVTTVL